MARIEVLLCYAQEDEDEMAELAIHLGALRRQGFFNVWYRSKISVGVEWRQVTDEHLNTAHIIVLLISQYFMDSDYCYCVEMAQAMERHDQGTARIIPVILRPVYYQRSPFAKLKPLPTNHKPIKSWRNRDEAFFDVAEGIRQAVEELHGEL